ncbi:MAG: MBL fold metallo-hydrolase [Selenomonadaceae bacterium]|nr:MBL fold metallo-hydrolase [Selenomonadaceae bacterium]
MEIEVLASGSKGNVTVIRSGGKFFLIDCGKPYSWTMERLNHKLPEAIILTHEHGDHAYAAKTFLKRGVEMYMTTGTAQALELESRHNLRTVKAGEKFSVADAEVTAVSSIHDAAEPVNFILQDEVDRVLYVTDTGAIPPVEGDFKKILIEANFSESVLLNSDIGYVQKRRILENHLSIEQVKKFLQGYRKAGIKLLHMSKRHADEENFYRFVGRYEQWQSAQN